MQDPIYTLNELASMTGKSKNTLHDMIDSGELAATKSENGRRSWAIRRSAALAANLELTGGGSIDAAVRDHLQDSLEPVLAQLGQLRDTLEHRCDRLELFLLDSIGGPTTVNNATGTASLAPTPTRGRIRAQTCNWLGRRSGGQDPRG